MVATILSLPCEACGSVRYLIQWIAPTGHVLQAVICPHCDRA